MPVRAARPGDDEAVLALLAEVYAAFEEPAPPEEEVRRLVGASLAGTAPLAFLVFEGPSATLEGLVSLAPCASTRDAREFVYLDDLYVRPSSRGHGVALELLGAARRWAVARGATEIRLAADSADEGLWNLYREAGYERQRMNWMVLRLGRDWAGRRK